MLAKAREYRRRADHYEAVASLANSTGERERVLRLAAEYRAMAERLEAAYRPRARQRTRHPPDDVDIERGARVPSDRDPPR